MYRLVDKELEIEMDRAINYLAYNLNKSKHNTKPVLIHSIAVGMTLYELEYSKEIVLSGLLHDLIEDTDIKYQDILNDFGKKIADIVQAVSFDPNIEDKYKQTDGLFKQIEKYGYEAEIVKCADLYCNMEFIKYVEDNSTRDYLIYKYQLFIKLFGNNLKEESIYKEYLKLYAQLLK